MDGLEARLEKLTGIVAFFLVLGSRIGFAGFAIFDGRFSEDELAVGVDVDLGHTSGDGGFDLVIGDAGSAMEDEGDATGGFLNLGKGIKFEAGPIFGINAVDISNAGGEEVDAKGDDLLAFFGIGDFAIGGDTVFGATDRTDFGFDGEAFVVGEVNEFAGLFDIFFKRQGRAIEHDGGESGFDAFLHAFIGSVVEVKGDGDGDAKALIEGFDHGGDDFEAAHVFGGAFADAKNDGGFLGFGF